MPVNEHVQEISPTTNFTHMTLETQQGDSDAVYPLHFATIEEKKRLWFRDALINALFIASWCVQESRAVYLGLIIFFR